MTAERAWQVVDEILARPPVRPVRGQLAAFEVDTRTEPESPGSVDDAPAQLTLFETEAA